MLQLARLTTFQLNSHLRISFNIKRLIFPLLLTLALMTESLGELTRTTLADAYFQVTVFVASTLYVYFIFAKKFPNLELSRIKQKSPLLEMCYASVLGALPGCGGAIIVVTQYTKQQASFGALVAVLTATMGDAAFLLLAKQPMTAISIIAIGIVVGILSGLTANALPAKFQPTLLAKQTKSVIESLEQEKTTCIIRCSQFLLWPSLMFALLIAFNFEFGQSQALLEYLGCTLALLVVFSWAVIPTKQKQKTCVTAHNNYFERVIKDTQFVSVWVIASFMVYEVCVSTFKLDISLWFGQIGLFAPLVAIFVGFIPGCGPQIVVTSLYLQGSIPFSALVGNAISNDGDALFPAIAMAPSAALVATAYSAIPAVIAAYIFHILV
ncbi:putative manganese transporter [Pseudoalteromonas byunsanensis]|uniref:Manganese transporter n=1 Tax=Pseudoalteromonas byunsanensis TaxID=327939 RepID=A0A1S1N9D7_9GAMM|nr:putative manganese transporter [Pseudoalteromonas byunsanensis]OHU96629.1 hypothetical protein BIW53_04680 [Pseudoalteromonas byunsanensis]